MTDDLGRRCVACDITYYGSFEDHCALREHQLNVKVNWVLRQLEATGLTLDDFVEIVKSRDKGSRHGRFTGPLD
jgi:hypothetical protein